MHVFGKNVAKEVLDKESIKRVYISKKFNDREILEKLKNHNVKIVDKKVLDGMEKGNHQGIIIEIDDYKYYNIDELTKESIIVMLDHLEDPHNFGAIIRTVEAAGLKSIIIPKDRSVSVTPTVIRTSVGTIENVKISRVTNLVNTINYLKKEGYWIIGTDMEGTDFKEIDYRGKIVIVIGNEGKGISRLARENCDFIASIPMKGKVNSLNASVASALVIYEAVRDSVR